MMLEIVPCRHNRRFCVECHKAGDTADVARESLRFENRRTVPVRYADGELVTMENLYFKLMATERELAKAKQTIEELRSMPVHSGPIEVRRQNVGERIISLPSKDSCEQAEGGHQ